MVKRIRNILFSFFALLAVITPIVSVSAASEQRHKSTINMLGGTQLDGAGREYFYKNHKISIKPTELDFAAFNTYNQVNISLQKKGLFGYGEKSSKTVKISEVGKTYTYEMGAHGKGTFRYSFFTGDRSYPWAGVFKADPVYMYSYE